MPAVAVSSTVCRITTTGRVDGLAKSTVTDAVDRAPAAGSATTASDTVTVGGGSPSAMVATAVRFTRLPAETVRRTTNVSAASDVSSASTGTVNVPVVLPAGMVIEPVVAV